MAEARAKNPQFIFQEKEGEYYLVLVNHYNELAELVFEQICEENGEQAASEMEQKMEDHYGK